MVMTPWQRLSDPDNADAVRWMSAFKAYNASMGNALTRLAEQPQEICGREAEIAMLHAVLERPRTPVALLLGKAGVGKTALVEEFVKRLNAGVYETHAKHTYLLFALRVGSLSALGRFKIQSILSTILEQFAKLEKCAQTALNDPSVRIVLFIDEVHMIVTIFGPGTKTGGDVMKDTLARSPIRVIAATTRREYDSTIAVDVPLAERFKQIEMQELSPDVVKDIARNWWSAVAPDCPRLNDIVIDKLIKANAAYRPDAAEPRKTIDVLEDLVSYCRRTALPATDKQLEDVFKQRYSISLKFKIDADTVFNEIARRIQGQPVALYQLKRLLRSMVYQLDRSTDKPIMTALFTGPTGVGKTETCKAIADKIYPDEDSMFVINMPDYKTVEHEPGFRKRLGEHVRHMPNAVILLDEFEKAHESVRDSMLSILDEGIVSFEVMNREGSVEVNSASLRNTIVIATTNAGADVFANDTKYSQRGARAKDELDDVTKSEVHDLMNALLPNLQANGFKPEMLGRFDRVIPYRGLAADTLLKITESEIKRLCDAFATTRGIKIITEQPHQWPVDVYPYFTSDIALYITFIRAKLSDSNAGGARAIKREVSSLIYEAIVDALIEHPSSHTFKLAIDKKSAIYDPGSAAIEGGVSVNALD